MEPTRRSDDQGCERIALRSNVFTVSGASRFTMCPESGHVDPLRTGNAPREQIGHRQETGHVELADDNGRGRADLLEHGDRVRVRSRLGILMRPVESRVRFDQCGETSRHVARHGTPERRADA